MTLESTSSHPHKNTGVFTPENLMKLKSISYEYSASAGSYLYWEGDPADKLFYIIEGQVRITKATDDGKQLTLYIFQNDDLFGQLDSLQDSTHSFNAEVTEDSILGIIQLRDLEILLWQHGDLAVEFMKWMGLMHRITQTKFRDLLLFGKPGALCSVLIRLSNSYGEQHGEHILIPLRLTNTELAEMIGATRESVNRMLAEFKKQDIIQYEDNLLIIKDITYLRDLCHCENCPGTICRM
ncbi:MAG: Crp/Fnr family transcriptional regulator [Paenibacillaceae bacterium]